MAAVVAAAGLAVAGAGCAGGGSPALRSPSLDSGPGAVPSGAGSGSGAAAASDARAVSSSEQAEASLAPLRPVATPADAFIVAPYLQRGEASDAPAAASSPRSPAATERLALLWHTAAEPEAAERWTVEVRPAGAGDDAWRATAAPPASRLVAVSGIPALRVWQAALTGRAPGALFDYRVSKRRTPVFAARARAPRAAASATYRFVVFGDCATGSAAQKAVAYQAFLARPDFVFIPGDIVYDRGRISEYREKFFPVYNAEQASPEHGAPLLRSTLFLAAPGNHDIATRDLDQFPDGLAYFLYWSQPGNGPLTRVGAPSSPVLSGGERNRQAFLDAAGSAYPRMANFSFRYGSSHWTVLDANPYVDWNDPGLRAWLESDLKAARNATWRFVAFHHPGFHSSKEHAQYQKMRVLAPIFEKHGVDVVWSGHVHNYQRSFPLRFAPPAGGKFTIGDKGEVPGIWTLDKAFDGKTRTRPNGVLYLVTGAGGAGLYSKDQGAEPASWQPFTAKYVSDTHSLTVAEVAGRTLTVRQIAAGDGKELDRFVVTKGR